MVILDICNFDPKEIKWLIVFRCCTIVNANDVIRNFFGCFSKVICAVGSCMVALDAGFIIFIW